MTHPTPPDAEQSSPAPDPADAGRIVTCFSCVDEYCYLGSDTHPGVCPDCGGRAVSFAGDPRVVSPERELVEKSHLRFSNVLRVVARDDTDRAFEYLFALTGGIGEEPLVATAKYVRIGDEVVEPTGDGSHAELFPNAVGSVVREITGNPLRLPADRGSETGRRASDADEDGEDGGIGALP